MITPFTTAKNIIDTLNGYLSTAEELVDFEIKHNYFVNIDPKIDATIKNGIYSITGDNSPVNDRPSNSLNQHQRLLTLKYTIITNMECEKTLEEIEDVILNCAYQMNGNEVRIHNPNAQTKIESTNRCKIAIMDIPILYIAK